jgi:hypothetical protein
MDSSRRGLEQPKSYPLSHSNIRNHAPLDWLHATLLLQRGCKPLNERFFTLFKIRELVQVYSTAFSPLLHVVEES